MDAGGKVGTVDPAPMARIKELEDLFPRAASVQLVGFLLLSLIDVLIFNTGVKCVQRLKLASGIAVVGGVAVVRFVVHEICKDVRALQASNGTEGLKRNNSFLVDKYLLNVALISEGANICSDSEVFDYERQFELKCNGGDC